MMTAPLNNLDTALLIIVGADNWPKSQQFTDSNAFAQSKFELKEYFERVLGFTQDRILDLFNNTSHQAEHLKKIEAFLQLHQNDCNDIFFYYIGHGLFTGRNEGEYAFAIKDTQDGWLEETGLRAFSIAKCFDKFAKAKRSYFIVDACFSEKMAQQFQANIDDLVLTHLNFGTIVLSSSSSTSVSKLEQDHRFTQFTHALVLTLNQTHPNHNQYLSFSDVCVLVNQQMKLEYGNDMIQAKLQIPSTDIGDIGKLGVFPNKITSKTLKGQIISGSGFWAHHFHSSNNSHHFKTILESLVRDESGNSFEIETVDKILSSIHGSNVLFKGHPGVGKTIVASTLFHYLNHQSVPIMYIDLASFQNNLSEETENIDCIVSNILEHLDKEELNSNLIIDGCDVLNPLYSRVRHAIETRSLNGFHVFWFERSYQTKFRAQDQTSELNESFSDIFTVGYKKGYSKLSNDEAYLNLVTSIFPVDMEVARQCQQLLEHWVFENRNNLRLLHLTWSHYERVCGFKSAREFLDHVFKVRLQEHPSAEITSVTQRSLEFAYSLLIQGQPLSVAEPIDFFIKRIVTISEEMMAYLSAKYICNAILHHGQQAKTDKQSQLLELNYVYPHLINKYAKNIIIGKEKAFYDAIDIIYFDCSINLRAFLTYLLGRISRKAMPDKPKRFLLKEKTQDEILQLTRSLSASTTITKEQKEKLVLYRTVFISLIYLADDKEEEEKEYINLIEANIPMDRINRGFHLAYYGDSNYFDDMEMLSDDDCRPFVNTLHQISENIEEESSHSATNLFIYTLSSLAFSRLEQNRLEETIAKPQLRELCCRFLLKQGISEKNRQVLHSLISLLDSGLPPLSHQLVHMYELKKQPRTGWNNAPSGETRSVLDAESVSSHVDAAIRLAVAYLPEDEHVIALLDAGEYDLSEQYRQYSKYHIIKLLSQHDIGEWKHGDIPRHQANDQSRSREKRAVYELVDGANANNSPYLAFTRETIFDLWCEYDEQRTINAKIARDIDKLECLIQLYLYRQDPNNVITDFKAFENNLTSSNFSEVKSTVIGKALYKTLVEPLGQRINKLEFESA